MDPVELKSTAELPAEALVTLAEIGEEINASLDLDEVLAKAAGLTKRLVEYEIFAVLLVEEGTRRLYIRFAIGHLPEVVEHWRIPIGEGVTGKAAETRQPVLVEDVNNYPGYLNGLESVRSELAIPLVLQGQVIGVLDIQSREPGYFKREHQTILTLMASRIAGAIENARLFEKVRRQADTLLLLNEVGREVSSLTGVEEVLRRAAELTKRVIDYQTFSIFLFDEKEQVFRLRVTVKFGQSVQRKYAVPLEEGIVGAAATLRRPVVVSDVTRDPRYLEVNPETRSELAVPLVYKNRVIGVMDLESPQLNHFTADHAQALSILAAHLAVSIENARLYEQLARDEAVLERDMNAAQRLQGALLPRLPDAESGLDIAARVVSSRQLSGDIYDFIRYRPQEIGFALGDVSGKGSAAALYGAVAIGTLRSLGSQKLGPAAMLNALNVLLSERRIEERFMTMCYATWHKGNRRFRIANAGQEQPLLFHGGEVKKVKLTGFPLGMFQDITYDEVRLPVDAGDILVFYSDGLCDTTDANGNFFGADRLGDLVRQHAALPSGWIADRILEAVETFSNRQPAFDDRTLVVLKVK